jgi:hypothetical protein
MQLQLLYLRFEPNLSSIHWLLQWQLGFVAAIVELSAGLGFPTIVERLRVEWPVEIDVAELWAETGAASEPPP